MTFNLNMKTQLKTDIPFKKNIMAVKFIINFAKVAAYLFVRSAGNIEESCRRECYYSQLPSLALCIQSKEQTVQKCKTSQ